MTVLNADTAAERLVEFASDEVGLTTKWTLDGKIIEPKNNGLNPQELSTFNQACSYFEDAMYVRTLAKDMIRYDQEQSTMYGTEPPGDEVINMVGRIGIAVVPVHS